MGSIDHDRLVFNQLIHSTRVHIRFGDHDGLVFNQLIHSSGVHIRFGDHDGLVLNQLIDTRQGFILCLEILIG